MAKKQDLNDVLRAALTEKVESQISLLQISKETEIPYASLHGYFNGVSGLHSRHIATLYEYLGFPIPKRKQRK